MPRKKRVKRKFLTPAHKTSRGAYYVAKTEDLLTNNSFQKKYAGKIDLILTSPPFPLNNKKRYGNLRGEEYLKWITSLAPQFEKLLSPRGSLVIEIGNSWQSGRPVQSLLALKTLLALASREEKGGLRLIQEFVCYNPSRLPSPAQWVTVNRIRLVDSYTHVWWLAKTDYPDADNSRVTRPYSDAMKKLLSRGSFNHGMRPSQHKISKNGFLKNQNGAIAHNLFEMEALDPNREVRLPNAFSFSNTASKSHFDRACKQKGIVPHPARMPMGLAAFFIQFLTPPGAIVFDPFAGSNTTGYAAEKLKRRWLAIDAQKDYAEQSRIRFSDPTLGEKQNGSHSKHRSNKHFQKKSKYRGMGNGNVCRPTI